VTASNLSVLPGAVFEKSAATVFSTGTWVGSWPVPRQQYQRRLAGGNENGVSVASGASVAAVVAAAEGAEVDDVDGLQAPAMNTAAPSRPRILGGLVRTGSSFSNQPATNAGASSRVRLAPDRTWIRST
jgi:hypothetical protein